MKRPEISVVMSTYNRAEMLPAAVESVLAQTFENYEFIIINDCSTDNTLELLNRYKDSRIKVYTNKINCGCTFNYHNAQNLAKGKYIAHIDDDDISLPERLKKQYDYMEENSDIALLGTFIETFGENKRASWVLYSSPLKIDFMMNLYNPICHSAILYRKSFVDKFGINYDVNKKCSQDYDFYKQIMQNGGKMANLEEVLVRYRMHPKRITDVKDTQNIQIYNADIVKKELRQRILSNEQISEIERLTEGFPFNDYNKSNVISAINMLEAAYKKTDESYMEVAEEIKRDVEDNLFTF